MSLGSNTAAVLGVCLVVAACNKTPPEPVSADAHEAPATVTSAVVAVGQAGEALDSTPPVPTACVRPLASAPPPAVSAAPADRCPKDPTPNAKLATTRIRVGTTPLDVELAETDEQSQKGLMFRTAMAEDHGMLFDLHDFRDHEFWMHNTCIPLDMLFIDKQGKIVGILENVPVLNDDPRSVGCPSSWVLETNAGWSRRHGVHPGDTVALPKQ